MKILSVSVLALISGLIAGGAAYAQESSALRTTSNPSVTLIGSGCALNNGANTHWEGGTLVVNFAAMVAEKGHGIALPESRKNCSITVDIKVPEGLSYALTDFAAAGYDDLAAGDTRTLTVTNFFQGQSGTQTIKDLATGPRGDSFNAYHSSNGIETLWSPCNLQRALTITTAVRVASGNDREVDSASGLDSLRLNFRVKSCAAR